jgi:hypothetical protein
MLERAAHPQQDLCLRKGGNRERSLGAGAKAADRRDRARAAFRQRKLAGAAVSSGLPGTLRRASVMNNRYDFGLSLRNMLILKYSESKNWFDTRRGKRTPEANP